MRSNMVHTFSEVPRASIPRSSFNRSHGYKTTFDADYLIPVYVDEMVPGDTFNCGMNFFARLATPLYPIMDNLFLDSFFFFVPYRLIWPNWKKMHGEQDDPGDSISYTTPTLSGASVVSDSGDLAAYFALPLNLVPDNTDVSALPFRAYRLIWNEWFRDQNLDDSLEVATDDGPDDSTQSGHHAVPLKRNKRHDYFTSCLPWPQKGDAVSIFNNWDVQTDAAVSSNVGIYSTPTSDHYLMDANASNVDVSSSTASAETNKMYVAADDTINDLRLAFQTQRLLERDARSGTRYRELILSHFGVTVPDFRLQRPEFLGGGSTPVNISPVAQTSGQPTPAADDKLGNLAAIGTVSGRHGFTYSAVEFGIVIGLVNVRSDITYSQGLERFWSKQTRYDYYYPVLSQIGEQTVLNKEIYHQNSPGTGASQDEGVFGYQERYAEYRYKPSRLTGLFAVDAANNIDEWHLSEDFSSLPTLGATFIKSNTGDPLDRAIAIPSEPQFIFDACFQLQCARPMPLYGVPGNLDHL